MTKTMYTYFVSYAYTKFEGGGFGNSIFSLSRPPLSAGDFLSLTGQIEKSVGFRAGEVIILNFQLLSATEEAQP
jgi:hypothetical protein